MRVRVGVGCGVTDWVMVGVAEMSGVGVAVAEAVWVGLVAVGKGSSRACAVPIRAVFVASTLFPDPSCRPWARLLLKTSW